MNKFKRIKLFQKPGSAGSEWYDLTIYDNGKIKYHGQAFVKFMGDYEWQISKIEIDKINKLIEKYDYMNIKHSKNLCSVTDTAGCQTIVYLKNGKKKDIDYIEDENNWPKKVNKFQNELKKIINVYKYAEYVGFESYIEIEPEPKINLKKTMECLFETKPKQLGLRGNEFLWDDMKIQFFGIPIPENFTEIKKLIEEKFKEITGYSIDDVNKEHFFMKRYDRGGMSSGCINPEWWRKEAIQQLIVNWTKIVEVPF